MPRAYSHNAILLSGALASSSLQKVNPQSESCWGSLLEPSQHPQHHPASLPLHWQRSGQKLIFPSKNLRGEAEKVFKGFCFVLEPHCLINTLATRGYLTLYYFQFYAIKDSVLLPQRYIPNVQKAQNGT